MQDGQGVLLQLQTACETVPQNSNARKDLNEALRQAEILLERLRDQADIRTQRLRSRSEGR